MALSSFLSMLVGIRGIERLKRRANSFSQGPRLCIGQQFALTTAGFVIVRLLQQFDEIQNVDPCDHIVIDQTITASSGNGAKVRLHQATA